MIIIISVPTRNILCSILETNFLYEHEKKSDDKNISI